MNRRILGRWAVATLTLALLASTPWALAQAQDEAPDALIKRVSSDVLESIKADKAVQAGETSRVISLVDSKIIPHVNFVRMTAAAVGRNWRQATPEQQKRLQEEFKILLIRTYSGALAQVKDQSVNVNRCVRQLAKPSWWCAARCWAGATPCNLTTAWKKPPPAGRFMT